MAGGKGHPRISLRGPFEGQSPWNKDTHWAQIRDLFIFMQVSPSKEVFK